MMKKFVLSLIISCGAFTAVALPNVNNLRDTISDNNIVPPNSFEASIEDLENQWYEQNYITLSTPKEDNAQIVTPTDEIYIQRLQRLQNEVGFVIEMPYNSVVKSYIEMYTGKRRRGLVEKMLGMWLYYEPIFEAALLKEGLPIELKYLPIIESALNPNAVSPAAAAGLWQFIPSTGKGMGLEISSLVDERRDTYKASQKAAEFLKQLYNTYNDWSLAIAAYNCGPGNVNKAIRRAGGGKKDFWEIYNYLPKETRGYVPAFIAAAYVMNYHNEHGISTALAKKPLLTDTIEVRRRINFNQIAEIACIDVKAIKALNPQYLKSTIPGGPNKPYVLILPSQNCYIYTLSENQIGAKDAERYTPRERAEPGQKRQDPQPQNNTASNDTQPASNNSQSSANSQNSTNSSNNEPTASYTSKEEVVMHEVKSGETLKSIANMYGTNTSRIKKDNNLTSNVVSRGQVLKIVTYKKVLSEEATQPATNNQSSSNSTTSKSYSSNNSNNSYSNSSTNSTTTQKSTKKKKKKQYNSNKQTNNNQQQASSTTTPSYKKDKKKTSTKSSKQTTTTKSTKKSDKKATTTKSTKKSDKKSTTKSTTKSDNKKNSTTSKTTKKSDKKSTTKSTKKSDNNKKSTTTTKSTKKSDKKSTTTKSTTKSDNKKKSTTTTKSTKKSDKKSTTTKSTTKSDNKKKSTTNKSTNKSSNKKSTTKKKK